MRSRSFTLVFLIALTVGVGLRARDLLDPYENGHRGACAAFFALMAKNHLRYGLLTTAGVSVLNPVKVKVEHFNYYLHHPPGAVLLAWLGAALGGTNPVGLRLIFLPLSIGIVLLIYQLARDRSRRAAATAAAGTAALLPIAAYYGAFVNFEIPTLFFSLLTLHFHLRYLRRARTLDRHRSMIAYAAAVGCDWIALGLPLCLMVIAPFTAENPRFRRRAAAGHAALLLAVGVAVVVLVKLLYHVQLSRFGVDPDHNTGLLYYLSVTPLAPGFEWSAFGDRVGTYLMRLFTAPVLLLMAVGAASMASRLVRRRLDRLDVAAATFTAMGVANVVILANHAMGHDYYLLYLMPAAALLVGRAFADLAGVTPRSPRAIVVLLGLVALLAHLGYRSHRELVTRESFLLSEVGVRIAEMTPEGAVVLLPHHYTSQVAVTADRFVWHASDPVSYERACDLGVRFGMQSRPLYYVVDRLQLEKLSPEMVGFLNDRGERSEQGPFVIFNLGYLRS